MNKNTFKSIGAVVAGIVIIIALTLITDAVLEGIGVLPRGPLGNQTGLQILELVYRTIYNIIGGFAAARLAPNRPMRHAVIMGIVSTIMGLLGAAATWNLNLAPAWYSAAIVVVALPCAWLGGRLVENKKSI
ncbi:MAG: hypothetical protein HYR70_01655 [Chloroflexi bacterium]|nr:hypothetical protein [Chloroflexota bacterium]MBI3341173.1 hypothetical protein [Chloroflexota bacterium]